ncbi:GNAT family N-acetyltransferase [Streptomyces sp. AC495_CC817]|uniref:GNAT family N-acetyltransferase n=1 Tax=Streptomyces sp. AC495_CC817 TaxID=2823900 RepID=UPI001C274174|nr:GNAT family N-acetyltransferase [Streptomyces sp. AC495_CC817]
MPENLIVRPATDADIDATVEIETVADALLIDLFGAVDWPPPADADERRLSPGFVLVAEHSDGTGNAQVVGFVQVLDLGGHAHLEQLSVLPSHGRRGIGRLLVDAALVEARRRGHESITLRTYADVPWNAPFYASCGFVESTPETDLLRSLIEVERSLGLLAHGRRVQMTAAL